jgi:hypothetical protein
MNRNRDSTDFFTSKYLCRGNPYKIFKFFLRVIRKTENGDREKEKGRKSIQFPSKKLSFPNYVNGIILNLSSRGTRRMSGDAAIPQLWLGLNPIRGLPRSAHYVHFARNDRVFVKRPSNPNTVIAREWFLRPRRSPNFGSSTIYVRGLPRFTHSVRLLAMTGVVFVCPEILSSRGSVFCERGDPPTLCEALFPLTPFVPMIRDNNRLCGNPLDP